MIASPWVFRYIDSVDYAWNSVIVGAAVVVLACVSEAAPEARGDGEQPYRPSPGWDYPYYAHPDRPGEAETWYAPSSYGGGPGSVKESRSVAADSELALARTTRSEPRPPEE
jgi:hypothetical protein